MLAVDASRIAFRKVYYEKTFLTERCGLETQQNGRLYVEFSHAARQGIGHHVLAACSCHDHLDSLPERSFMVISHCRLA